jgi:hypothetical protein
MIYHISLDNADKETIKEYLEPYKTGDYVVGSCVHEAHDWENIYQKQFEPFIELCNQKRLKFDIIVNETYLDKPFRIPNYDPIVINFFAVNAVYRIKHTNVKNNTTWNSNAKKFLFLTGKADKINRVGLLAELINLKLKKKMIWSFFPGVGTDIYKRSIPLFQEFSSQSYKEFCKKYEQSPDNVVAKYSNNGTHYSGFPFDINLYKNTAFSVISESEFQDDTCVWQTEKTFKTIINKHPFIMASQLGSIERLKEQGFKTFEEYQLDPDYYKIENTEKRILSIAKNAQHWIKNLNNIEEIKKDVEHNYKRLFELFDETIDKHEVFKDKLFYSNFFSETSIKNA